MPEISLGNFVEKGDVRKEKFGMSFVIMLNMEVRVYVYNPLRGSSINKPLQDIAMKKAVVNVLSDAGE